MATSTSLRTVWITIRATNYAFNTFNQLIGQMANLQKTEASLIQTNLNLTKSAMSVGILFSVLGQQIGGIGGQFMEYFSYMAYGMAILQGLTSVIRILDSGLLTHMATAIGLKIAWWEIFVAIGAAAGVFMLLKDNVGVIAAGLLAIATAAGILALALWSSATAMSTLTWGAAAIAGGAAIAGAAAVGLHAAGMFQMGTRMVGQTGSAFVHHGEVIYNPSTGRPTQVGNDLSGGLGGGVTTIDASLHVETLNTKASEEQLNELLRKQGRKIAEGQR